MKKLITCLFLLFVSTYNMYAQEEAFFVPTASKYKRWEFVKTETDKAGKGKALVTKLKKEFGLATSINIETDGNYMWNVTNTKGNTTSIGLITEKNDFVYFKFTNKKVLKASPSFREYDTIMELTLYGKNKKEFATLTFKAVEN